MKRAIKSNECSGHNPMFVGIPKYKIRRNKKLFVPEYVTNLVPRYLPNLQDLQLSKKFIETDGVVVSALPHDYQHDAGAAKQLQEQLCIVFDIPRSMFPYHAPLNKITYMPPQLLPAAFDAGGVFASGVLAQKFYPVGLLPKGHRGPTPALFVGRRCDMDMPHDDVEDMQPYGCTEYAGLPVGMLPKRLYGAEAGVNLDEEDEDMLINVRDEKIEQEGQEEQQEQQAAGTAEQKEEESENRDIKVGYIIVNTYTMDKVTRFANQPLQYNIYVPDLSKMQVMVHSECKYVTTVLSNVVHPHEPELAKALKDELEVATFKVPPDFYNISLDLPMKRSPVFLPQRLLPSTFAAGCVFGPGTLPETIYMRLLLDAPPQMQHNKAILPPVFLGIWKNNCTPLDCMFPKQSFLINMGKTSSIVIEQVDVTSGKKSVVKMDEDDEEDDEDEEEEDDDMEETDITDDYDDDDEEEEDEEMGAMGLPLDPELVKPGTVDERSTNDVGESAQLNYDEDMNEEVGDEEPRVPPLPELPELPPPPRDPRLWFFELSGHPEEIMNSLHRVSNAGVKLASSYTDQETIKRAREQWMDLIKRRDEISEQMNKVTAPREPHVKTQRRHQPKPGTVCSFCGHVFQ